MSDVIGLAHGSGGEASRKLVEEIVGKYLKNDVIDSLDDSAVLDLPAGRVAFTTDSYVVDPVFFPGGDIGSLAVNGTVNDLAMVGAVPVAITLGLILEEGLALADLHRILESVRRVSDEAGVIVAGGDTKVVERGSADRIFINTSGIGTIRKGIDISSSNAEPGDAVILSGSIGDHGIAVISKREGIDFETGIASDTAPLNRLVAVMLGVTSSIHTMRDPTRGGLATSLNEIAHKSGVGIVIDEAAVPVKPEVMQACEMLGFDPFYVANEGKLVAFVSRAEADGVLQAMKTAAYGQDAAIVGEVTTDNPRMVVLNTAVGGRRILSPLSGELLPRIC
ncbi:MAG: hydrogenase expression/formation protein HypE [Candidatus Eisenbacteria bacterium]